MRLLDGFKHVFETFFRQFVGRIFGQIVDQIFGQIFDQGFWPGFMDQKLQCTLLLGRRNTVYSTTGTETYSFTVLPGRRKTRNKTMIPYD